MPALTVATLRSAEPPAAVLDEWRALFAAQPGPANPFLHPAWILGWLRAYDAEPVIHLVRRDDTGELVGIAPHWIQPVAMGPLRMGRRLLPVGSGFSTPLEIAGLLAAPEFTRDVTRSVVAATLDETTTDWQELSLAGDRGWFEPEWVFGRDRVAFGEHVRSRACVILPLADTWAQTRSGLKRNVKESVRRSTNRLAKLAEPTEVRIVTGEALDRGVIDRFLDLHRSRSEHDGSGIDHHDAYADPRHRELLRIVLPQVAREGLASIVELWIAGRVVAAQLALRAPGTSYVHSSGFDPAVWALGPTTLLQSEVIRSAIEHGDRVVNFSPGPSVSKLRWSEQLWTSNDFAYGCGGRSLGVRYGAFTTLRSLRSSANAIRFAGRQRVAGSESPGAQPVAGGESPSRSGGAGAPAVSGRSSGGGERSAAPAARPTGGSVEPGGAVAVEPGSPAESCGTDRRPPSMAGGRAVAVSGARFPSGSGTAHGRDASRGKAVPAVGR